MAAEEAGEEAVTQGHAVRIMPVAKHMAPDSAVGQALGWEEPGIWAQTIHRKYVEYLKGTHEMRPHMRSLRTGDPLGTIYSTNFYLALACAGTVNETDMSLCLRSSQSCGEGQTESLATLSWDFGSAVSALPCGWLQVQTLRL